MTYNRTGLPGDGPWKILDECPMDAAHNSVRAATGRSHDGTRTRCVCPRSLVLLKEYNRKQVRQRNRKAEKANGVYAIYAINVGIVNEVPIPRFKGTEPCQGPKGLLIFDDAVARPGTKSVVREAQRLCAQCPLQQQEDCRAWVLGAEIEPGSWGGVYGGLGKYDRIEIAAAKRKRASK